MGKSKKKGKGGGGSVSGSGEGGTRKPGRRELQRQRQDNERRADAALAAYISKLGINDDSDLFAPLLPKEDCMICMVILSVDPDKVVYLNCCGKKICCACYRSSYDAQVHFLCIHTISAKIKRMQANDDKAYFALADSYRKGEIVEKDAQKAFDLTLRGVELGDPKALNALSMEYDQGEFVARNEDRRRACMDASARRGDYAAHYNLGLIELIKNRNMELAVKHYHIAAAAGLQDALNRIREMCQDKHASNEDYLRACRAYQAASAAQSTEERTKWAETKKKTELLLASTI